MMERAGEGTTRSLLAFAAVVAAGFIASAAGCKGDSRAGGDTSAAAGAGGGQAAAAGSSASVSPPSGITVSVEQITPAMVATGDSIFRGLAAGGTCFSCHGEDAKGRLTVAPDLTDAKWLHGDGSYQAIVNTIVSGVPRPVESSGPMLPRGGAPLTDEQVRDVAAYVYTRSHPVEAERE